jgi:3-methyladenine DNA glycosylase Tag
LKEIPATINESDTMSKDFKNRDFKFVGSTICLCLHAGNRYGQWP